MNSTEILKSVLLMILEQIERLKPQLKIESADPVDRFIALMHPFSQEMNGYPNRAIAVAINIGGENLMIPSPLDVLVWEYRKPIENSFFTNDPNKRICLLSDIDIVNATKISYCVLDGIRNNQIFTWDDITLGMKPWQPN